MPARTRSRSMAFAQSAAHRTTIDRTMALLVFLKYIIETGKNKAAPAGAALHGSRHVNIMGGQDLGPYLQRPGTRRCRPRQDQDCRSPGQWPRPGRLIPLP